MDAVIVLNSDMKPEILVSVVIPTFERVTSLRRALESVATQNISDIEVIVVDDGSRDECSAIRQTSENMSDLNVRVVRHESNRGGAAARNTGVAHARGQYVAFLDSDDEWLPNKLETQLEIARNQPDYLWLSYCPCIVKTKAITDEPPDVWPKRAIELQESIGDYLFVNRGFMATPTFFLPRQLAIETPFNEELRRHQDYDLLLRLEARGCRFVMTALPLAIVHWENLRSSGRGFSESRSLSFLREYRRYLSPRAESGFIIQQIVFRSLQSGMKAAGWRNLFLHCNPRHLTLLDWMNVLSLTAFGDARIAASLSRLNNLLKLK